MLASQVAQCGNLAVLEAPRQTIQRRTELGELAKTYRGRHPADIAYLQRSSEMTPDELTKLWQDFANSNTSDEARVALDKYIDARCSMLICSTDWNGAQLIRIGSVDSMLERKDP
jgi:hypothetical protein